MVKQCLPKSKGGGGSVGFDEPAHRGVLRRAPAGPVAPQVRMNIFTGEHAQKAYHLAYS